MLAGELQFGSLNIDITLKTISSTVNIGLHLKLHKFYYII
jgi:hypothetical protein